MSGGGVGLVLKPTYLGPDLPEARAAEQRAREAGLTVLRARIVAHIASFKDGWIFRRRLAKTEGCSVRTVQRAITQAREEGLIGVARAKQGEKPPGAAGTFACGWSHRWIIGRGRAAAAALAAVAAAKLAALVRTAAKPPAPQPRCSPAARCASKAPTGQRRPPARSWTAEEIDQALADTPPATAEPPPDVGRAESA
jgi:hypothetical protein